MTSAGAPQLKDFLQTTEWNHSYHMNLPNEVLLEHLSGICRMAHVLKALRGISACLLQQNLFTSWMLKAQNTLEHHLIFTISRVQL